MATIPVRGSNLACLAVLTLLLLAGSARAEHEQAEEGPGAESPTAFERTPPRLSLVDGEVSFWRPGAEDWGPAQVNVALAPGDHFWTGADSNLEIQIGAHAFVRAGAQTELALMTQEPDYLQFRVGSGTASLDLRRLAAGHTVELATPNGAFSIERTGYYRVDVEDDATKLTSRRGGLATLTPEQGPALEVAPSEQVIIAAGPDGPQIETYAAPELDDWDTWNYRRTDRQLEALSARYVNDEVYGLSDLDQHGSWRRVQSYGSVWIPRAVPVGWAPYTHGRWLYDPHYGWTWVDDAAWGWAPFHYGRWVRVGAYWAWAPGPIVVRSVYAPALVVFFGSPVLSVSITRFSPSLGWVALGWGEPCVPWWGHARWRSRPHWFGWGGPRVVNKVVIRHQTVVHVKDIHVYENERVPGAFAAVGRKDFGRRHVREARVDERPDRFERIHGELPVEATRASFVSDAGKGRRPPERVRERRVVATRAVRGAEPEKSIRKLEPGGSQPEPLVVSAPSRRERRDEAVRRPPFGIRTGAERPAPKAPPRFQATRRSAEQEPEQKPRELRSNDSPPPAPPEQAESREPAAAPERRATRQPRAEVPEREARRASSRRERPPGAEPSEAPAPTTSSGSAKSRPSRVERSAESPEPRLAAPTGPEELPGEPVNRVYPGRRERPDGGEALRSRPERSESPERARGAESGPNEGGSANEGRAVGRGRKQADPAELGDGGGGRRR